MIRHCRKEIIFTSNSYSEMSRLPSWPEHYQGQIPIALRLVEAFMTDLYQCTAEPQSESYTRRKHCICRSLSPSASCRNPLLRSITSRSRAGRLSIPDFQTIIKFSLIFWEDFCVRSNTHRGAGPRARFGESRALRRLGRTILMACIP